MAGKEEGEAAEVAETPTSKTIVLTGTGGYDKLKIEQKPRPKPEKGEVLVNVKAAGVNFSELMARQGLEDKMPKLPGVLGLEAAGVVAELGEEVPDLQVGDRVLCLKPFGLWMEYAAVPMDACFLMPDSMTFEEAAAIGIDYVTAHLMLFNMANLRKGQSVLVHMAAGGVGIAATQLCKTVPDVTVFGTASAESHETIKEIGVTHPIDFRTQDYVQEIKKISQEGVDIVLDPLSGEDAVKGFNLLKQMGKIIHFGAANMMSGTSKNMLQMMKTWWAVKNINPIDLMSQNKGVFGFHMGVLVDQTAMIRECVTEILRLYGEGLVKPKIDSTWAFEDVGRAMAQMHERKNIGKVVLLSDKEPLPPEEKKKSKEKKKDKGKKKKVPTATLR